MTHLFVADLPQVDANGNPYNGATLEFDQTGTTTKITVYQDSAKGTEHTNPVTADSKGMFAPIYVDTNTYKVVYKTSAGVTILTIDPLYAPITAAGTTSSPANFADGTALLPGITFGSDPNSGVYRIGADNIGVTVGGAKALDISTTLLKSALNFTPNADDGAALGTTALKWSDVFLASGAVINFNIGDVTITHSLNTLAFAGASSGYSFDTLIDLSGASAGRIKFPAAQNASADANTLDDYEEGTWTPALAFGGATTGITYASQTGTYTKIGNLVYVRGAFSLSSKGSATGNATVSGFPFTAKGTDYNDYLGAQWSGMSTITGPVFVALTSNSANQPIGMGGAAASAQLTNSNFGNSSVIMFSGCYLAA